MPTAPAAAPQRNATKSKEMSATFGRAAMALEADVISLMVRCERHQHTVDVLLLRCGGGGIVACHNSFRRVLRLGDGVPSLCGEVTAKNCKAQNRGQRKLLSKCGIRRQNAPETSSPPF